MFPSAPLIYNLFPLLVGRTNAWRQELPRIAAMNFNIVWVNPFHAAGSSGSIYAIKDFSRLDPRFDSCEGHQSDQLSAFVRAAADHGLEVMADLVINHVARDCSWLEDRPDLFKRDEEGRIATPFAIDPLHPDRKTFWRDLAELDFERSASKLALIEIWDNYVAGLQRLGIRGFRCDAAHKLPVDVWEALIVRAKARDPECAFFAETLGCTLDRTEEIAKPFDFIFNNFNHSSASNFPVLEEYERLRRLTPSIAFPESHDTERFAAGIASLAPTELANRLRSRYLHACCFSTGVMIPLGFEGGFRKKIDVARSTPEDREEPLANMEEDIARCNKLKLAIPAMRAEGFQRRLSSDGDDSLVTASFDGADVATSRNVVITLVGGEHGRRFELETLARDASIPGVALRERTPWIDPSLENDAGCVTVDPHQIRIFTAALR